MKDLFYPYIVPDPIKVGEALFAIYRNADGDCDVDVAEIYKRGKNEYFAVAYGMEFPVDQTNWKGENIEIEKVQIVPDIEHIRK